MSLNPDCDFAHEHAVEELTRALAAQMEGAQSLVQQLREECERLRKDKERLDFVIERVAELYTVDVADGVLCCINTRDGVMIVTPSFRESIDTAMCGEAP